MKHIFVTLLLSFAAINIMAPDGIHIMYQPLEICEPEIVIPFDEAKPFLTDEALRLISR